MQKKLAIKEKATGQIHILEYTTEEFDKAFGKKEQNKLSQGEIITKPMGTGDKALYADLELIIRKAFIKA